MIVSGFDQEKFAELLELPTAQRSENWEKDFLDQLPHCKFTLISDVPQEGPDHFPYMFIEIDKHSQTPIFQILNWISKAGVGLAINPKKQFPDYVFTFGMIWNFTKTGQFYTEVTNKSSASGLSTSGNNIQIQPGSKFFVGEPSVGFLPLDIRLIIKEFLNQQGVMAPKVLMLSQDQINYDLCFSAESFGSPDPSEYEGILQALSWFLPGHYSLAMVSENGLPSFFEL